MTSDNHDTWRDIPPYDAEARRERAEMHCRTPQHGRHIDTLPLEPIQPPLIHPPAFPKLIVRDGKPGLKDPDAIDLLLLRGIARMRAR